MIGIRVRDTFLDLPPDAVISFELNSPAYFGEDIDVINGEYSFPINLPLTPRNRGVLRNPQLIDNILRHPKDLPCEVWSAGMPLFKGTFTVTNSTNTEARCTVVMSPLSKLKDIKLAETSLDIVNFNAYASGMDANLAYAKDTATNPDLYSHIFFPLWNWAFDGRSEYDNSQSEWQNYYDIYTEAFINSTDIPAMPFVKLDHALSRAPGEIGYSFVNYFQTDVELRNLVLYNNYDMHTTDGDDNLIRPSTVNLQQHVNPDTYYTDLLKQTCRNFCLAPFVDYWDRVFDLIPLKDLLQADPRHDWTRKISHEYELDTVVDIPGIFGYDNVYADAPTDEFFEREKIDYERASLAIISPDDPNGFYLEYITDQQWELFHEDGDIYQRLKGYTMPPYIADATNKDEFKATLKTAFAPIVGVDLPDNDDNFTAKFPALAIEGSSYKKKTAYADRLLFYRGFETCSKPGKTYPFANSTIYNGARTVTNVDGSPAQYALTWRGPNGLFEKWWKPWYNRLLRKKNLKATLRLSEGELRAFNFKHRVRIGNQVAFVKKMKVTLTHAGIQPIEAEFVIM